jgi:hypothetical protein
MADKNITRTTDSPVETDAAAPNGDTTQAALTASVVGDITRSNTELARSGATSLAVERDAAVAFNASDGVAASSDVNDETQGTAVAFGAFVKNIGMAVAAAQEELDKTLRETAKQLSETKIEVVHTFEQELDDDGHLTNNGSAKMQALPLINYLMPTAYQWSRVYLEADMKVQEFNSKTGFDIQSKSSSGGLRLGGAFGATGFSANGGLGFGSSSNQTSVQNGYSMDNAAGSMHMEATLEPRGDIELPKPLILQKGPVLTATVTKIEDIKEENPPEGQTAKTIGKKATILVTVKTSQGQPNKSKTLDYSVDQAKINHSALNGLTTDDNGQITIVLRREGAAYDSSTVLPVQVIVWLGLVSKTVTLSM